MAFLKFIDKKGADSFISGIVQFGRLKEYLYIEKKKCVGKNDEMEGKYYTTKYQTPQGKGVNFTIDANKQKRNFALCLYHLNNKYSTSRIEEMFEFGEYVVKTEDELEFDKRIKNGAKENKYQLYSRDVLYYRDESIKDEMKIMDLMTNSLDDLSFIKRKEIFSYQNEKGADSFISGIVQFGRLKEYLYIEKKKCVGKNDEMEGKYYTTKYQTPQGKGVNFTIDANKQKRNFALCLYHLNNKYSTSRIEEMFEFGEYVVKTEDELEFDKRIKNGAKENKYQLYSRDVLYYRDESIKDEMKIMDLMTNSLDDLSFIKRKEIFSYQNEYRYLIVDELEERKNIRFEIGDLKDLATIMSKSEFLKTL